MSKANALSRETIRLVGETCLCLHARRAARALARRFDDAFRPLGLTSGQFSLMMALNRPDPPAMGAVATALAMDRTTLTAALGPLTRRGLVETAVDPADRRVRRLRLTPTGSALLSTAVPVWTREHATVAARLPGGDPERLRSDLRALS